MTPITFRRAEPSDAERTRVLFEQVFGKPMSLDRWKWKYDSARVGEYSWVATRGNEIVGHIGGQAIPLALNGTQAIALHMPDSMVSPSARGSGVYTRLLERAFEDWASRGVERAFGMPRAGADIAMTSLGCKRTSSLRRMIRPLAPTVAMLRRAITGNSPSKPLHDNAQRSWEQMSVLELDVAAHSAALTSLCDRAASNTKNRMLRPSPESLLARYVRAPDSRCTIFVAMDGSGCRGFAVQKLNVGRRSSMMDIAQVFAPQDRATRGLLVKKLVSTAKSGGCHAVTAHAHDGSRELLELLRAGFIPTRHAFGVHEVILRPSARTIGRVDYCLGDFDVI